MTNEEKLLPVMIRGFHVGNYENFPSSGMWRFVVLVRTDVSKERITFIIRVK
jgi:hypothetical protein